MPSMIPIRNLKRVGYTLTIYYPCPEQKHVLRQELTKLIAYVFICESLCL